MRVRPLFLAIALAGLATSALAVETLQLPEPLRDATYEPLVADARQASAACEAELTAGDWGAKCDVYKAAALKALDVQRQRGDWCREAIYKASADSELAVPGLCMADRDDLRQPVIQSLLEKRTQLAGAAPATGN